MLRAGTTSGLQAEQSRAKPTARRLTSLPATLTQESPAKS